MYEMRLLWQEVLREVERRSRAAVAPFTVGGKLDRSTPNAVGHVPVAGGGTGHEQGAEPPLGNPATDGQALHSLADGTRYWDAAGGAPTTRWEPLTNGDVAAPELVFAGGDVIMVEVPL